MRRSTKMLLMGSGRNDRSRDYDRMRQEHDPESRFRDRRGREHYDNGRYAPTGSYEGYDGGAQYGTMPYIPPIYERERRRADTQTGGRDYRAMNKIGFAVEGEMDRIPYGQEYDRYASDTSRTRGAMLEAGYHGAASDKGHPMPFTREIAIEWTGDMENGDGSKGPHWSMEQVRQVMEQRGIECDPLQFFAVLNAVYSDYCSVAKKHGVNKMDFYADLAKAWLDDADAVEDKAAKYFAYIVKH